VTPMELLGWASGLLALSWLLTGAVRRYALSTGLLDLPNARSSHTQPTPRGGGVAIVASFMLAVIILWWRGALGAHLAAGLGGAGLLVAFLGYMDDRHTLAARWRFLGHLAATAWLLAWLGPMPPVPVFGTPVDLGLAATLLNGLFVVWSINSFNFMDGIDGIAGVQACTMALPAAALTAWVAPAGPWPLAVLLAVCAAGFLIWNFPPARIFMGDAGSGFLGLMLASLTVASGQAKPELAWAWFILGGCFMVDATVTLARRWQRGEKVYMAHRSHAYQYAARVRGSHRPVTLAVAAINLAWLLPLAALVAAGRLDGLVGIAIAYTPLVALALHYKAGDRAAQGA
jgi:Fuc2NAc and GlcNAc transferase